MLISNIKNFFIHIYKFHNSIGCICSLSKAFCIVAIIYSGSNTKERGFVIGLSCRNGTKKKLFLFNNFPIFSAEPDNPSFVDIATTTGFPIP